MSGVSTLGRYQLRGVLGRGGMAICHRARAEGPYGFARDCVVKQMLPEHAKNAEFGRMLAQEAQISALLSHPNIVQLYEFGEENGELYLAMELVDGFDLRSILEVLRSERRLMPVGAACRIVADIAAALAYAHERTDEAGRALGIVHRDVSPSNIVIGRDGVAKLLDFGIAKAATVLPAERTRTGIVKGKSGYMSPEQAVGDPVDRRTDLFSLGVVLHEALTLRPLFKGANDLHALHLLREGPIERPSRARTDIPPALDAITMSLLARRVEDRPARAEKVVEVLTSLSSEVGANTAAVSAFLASLGPTLAPSPPRADDDAAPNEGRTKPYRSGSQPAPSRRRFVAIAAVVGVAAVGVATWISRHQHETHAIAPPVVPARTSLPDPAPIAPTEPTTPAPATVPVAAPTPRDDRAPVRHGPTRTTRRHGHGDVLKDPFSR
jgi:serine/threonine protein kinase